ncbi:MAG: T9SS type A sorting domain-containing protein [Saprospiraceae bacterium]|nr:T9SS type A sorting domain-containing protein [Saprospiraceae bacterium]
MNKSLLVIFLTFFSFQFVSAQRNCGSMDVLDRQLQENPSMFKNMEEIEKQISEYVKKFPQGTGQRYTVTIPTVVHVVYRTTTENISDAQIQTQIDVLNRDFSATNTDLNLVPTLFQPVIGNIEVQFCLASQTPSGQTTTGITRKSTTLSSWGTNDNVKRASQGGVDPWNPAQYLNIWVCNIGGGILGYAQFPGGPVSTDGVVLDYRYTGTIGTATSPFNKGRTATHEVGHWLNLRHIWGDANCGSDLVSDTPVHNTSNGGCPTYPHNSTCSGSPVEMTMNYMDYTDDACMYMFSQGQKSRMRGILEGSGSRASLQTSPGCTPVNPNTCNAPSGLAASSITTNSAIVSWSAAPNAVNYTFEYKLNSATTWISQTTTATSVSLTGLTASTNYNTRVSTNCAAGSSSFSSIVSFTTASTSCTDAYESNNSRNTAASIPVGTTITAKISSSTDNDWFRFNNTTSQRNVRVSLTNLPADYDLTLWRNNQQVGISQNDGTLNEQITYNNSQNTATYYARVYGYNGAFNNNICYSLLAQTSGSAFRNINGEEEIYEMEPLDDEFLVFPNPTSGEITLVVPFGKHGKGCISMFDMTGKLMYKQNLEGDRIVKTLQMDISEFQSGMYLVTFTSGDKVFTQKLAVMAR